MPASLGCDRRRVSDDEQAMTGTGERTHKVKAPVRDFAKVATWPVACSVDVSSRSSESDDLHREVEHQ